MDIKREIIESNLVKKGFIEGPGDHKYFYHEYNGIRTGAYTYTSRGGKFKTYGYTLFNRMKKLLKLDRQRDVVALLDCSMSEEEYNNILIEKRIIK